MMTMRKLLFFVISLCVIAVSCDDSTDRLGSQMMPANDMVQTFDTVYYATSRTVMAGNVLARTSTSYLGQFTDPESYTSIKSDFLSQLHCTENFEFKDSVVDNKIKSTILYLYMKSYVGDSLQPLKLSVYPLDKIMDPDQNYYTDIDPAKYYDVNSKPIAEKWFTYSDRTLSDSLRYANAGLECIRISLPNEIGQAIFDDYRANPEHFRNTDAFIRSGLPCSKGFYFKLEAGDGLLVSIDASQLTLTYDHFSRNDSITKVEYNVFAATEEVVQATHFSNINLESLVEDTQATYLKSPSGLFTELTLPIKDFMNSPHRNDTINSVRLALTRYNDVVQSGFKLNIPKKVLLVRADEYYNKFFENYNVADGKTSFITNFNNMTNTFEFSNITPLVNRMIHEYQTGTASSSYNKVLIIPVDATYDTSNNLVKLCHDFSMTSAKLVGGAFDKVKLNVVYSSYR